MNSVSRSRVFLDISIGATPSGRLVIELFNDKAPKTCEKVIDEFMIQGGDIKNGDGTGTVSIYEGKEFEDENLDWREIDAAGLVCSANRGKNTNGSQFFITLEASPHLNGKHTVFGRLVSGEDVIRRIASISVDADDRPNVPVIISRCGELERKRKRQDDDVPTTSAENGRGRPRNSDGEDTLMSGSPEADGRRRSGDKAVDEGLRGRPRKRSKQRQESQIDEEMLSSNQQSPVKIHKRKRSASPSRDTEDRREEPDHSRRRRRSLPNQYDRNDHSDRSRRDERTEHRRSHRQRSRDNERYRGSSRSRERSPYERDRYGGRQHSGRDRHRYQEYRDPDQHMRADRWRPGDSRLSHDDRGSSDSGVKFKGRGVMKYREPGRLS